MTLPRFDDHALHSALGMPIEINGERWLGQTAFWARAVSVVSLLAGGAILLFADWNAAGMPPEFWVALVWGGPSVVYFMLSFFVGRLHGNICRAISILAIVHIVVNFAAVILMKDREMLPLRLLLASALAAGLANLAVSAFWARRWIRQPSFFADGRQGFAVLDATGQSMDSDLGK